MKCKGQAGKVRPPARKASLAEDVAILFPPVEEALSDYPWTTRAAIGAAGTLLGLLVAKAAVGGPSPVQAAPKAPEPEAPARPGPAGSGSSTPAVPAQAPAFETKSLLTADDAMEFIEDHEGIRYRTYRDSRGKKTVGVGFNLQAPGARQMLASLGIDYRKVKSGHTTLTQDQVESLFAAKTEEALAGARRNIANFDDLPKDIQLVVVDMIYNLGVRGFLKFDDMVTALRRGDYGTMANAMWRSAWRRQVGGRAEKLIAMVRDAAAETGGRLAVRESLDAVFRSI